MKMNLPNIFSIMLNRSFKFSGSEPKERDTPIGRISTEICWIPKVIVLWSVLVFSSTLCFAENGNLSIEHAWVPAKYVSGCLDLEMKNIGDKIAELVDVYSCPDDKDCPTDSDWDGRYSLVREGETEPQLKKIVPDYSLVIGPGEAHVLNRMHCDAWRMGSSIRIYYRWIDSQGKTMDSGEYFYLHTP